MCAKSQESADTDIHRRSAWRTKVSLSDKVGWGWGWGWKVLVRGGSQSSSLWGRLLSFPFVWAATRTNLSFDRLPAAVYTSDVALTDDESSVGGGKTGLEHNGLFIKWRQVVKGREGTREMYQGSYRNSGLPTAGTVRPTRSRVCQETCSRLRDATQCCSCKQEPKPKNNVIFSNQRSWRRTTFDCLVYF